MRKWRNNRRIRNLKNSYEEIRKLVEENEDNNIVNNIKTKKKENNKENIKFKLFD